MSLHDKLTVLDQALTLAAELAPAKDAEVDALRAEVERLRAALGVLAGLHPCLTTDEPAVQAVAIFDAVMAERSVLVEERDNALRNTQYAYDAMRAAQASARAGAPVLGAGGLQP